jgi:toxin CcdB
MADHYTVYNNPGRNRQSPYIVVVQSNRFRQVARCVVVPLVAGHVFRTSASDIGPQFIVEHNVVILDPLQITNISKALLNKPITSLADHEDVIIHAIDVMLSRAWR